MVAIAQKTLSFEEFLNWDDDSGRSFELVNGVAMPLSEPTAKHEDVVDIVSFPEWGDYCHTQGDTYEHALKDKEK